MTFVSEKNVYLLIAVLLVGLRGNRKKVLLFGIH